MDRKLINNKLAENKRRLKEIHINDMKSEIMASIENFTEKYRFTNDNKKNALKFLWTNCPLFTIVLILRHFRKVRRLNTENVICVFWRAMRHFLIYTFMAISTTFCVITTIFSFSVRICSSLMMISDVLSLLMTNLTRKNHIQENIYDFIQTCRYCRT